ncbi:alpha/beta fold hydrolase [Paenibacillus eucommiae]|uniref:Proline iminopeptidase n=1 Tax=Paenibacillus eucommiae TaxID=1355755 RepID=A0ABS4IVA7_9BACL|nr:alpha/beta hydrolase [Paenibacillus eucommiae]MBP1991518.1 proline iminopeptidase [Paenibacillus eucommiae]
MDGIVSKINGVSLWHITQGQGIPMVLLHGGPGAYDYLEPIADMLDNRYKVIRYEQRGSWRSEKKGPYDVETFIDDLEHLRLHLGIDKWVVCGHSWGASVGLAYTVRYNCQVKALIYISGTGINPAWHIDYRINRLENMSFDEREEYTQLRSIVNQMSGIEREHTRNRIRELSLRADLFNKNNFSMLPRVDGQFVNNEVNQKVDCNEYLESDEFRNEVISSITAPVLLVHGEVDPRPYKYVKELASNLKNSEFRLISQSGHYPWLDNPTTLGKLIHDFVARKVTGI